MKLRPRLCATAIATLAALSAGPVSAAEYDCLMGPSKVVELGSAVAGLLEDVVVERGDRVERGEVVARLTSSLEQSTVELLELRANSTGVIDAQAQQVAMMERRYQRVADLVERGVSSQDSLDSIEIELISAQSLLMQAELNRDIAMKELVRAQIALGQRTITSPFDGIVREVVLSGGEYVDSNDHILKLVRLDPLRIDAFVPVSLFAQVDVGDRAMVRPARPLEGEFEAVVTSIDPVFDAASATYVVALDMPNPDGALPAGHRCRLEFVAGK